MAIGLFLFADHVWIAIDRQTQIVLAIVAAACGFLVDSLLVLTGVLQCPHGSVASWLPPPWMSVLWTQFATTFQSSMRWLSGRYALSACFGLVGAPLAFLAGEVLGAVTFPPPRPLHVAILAILWALLIPLLACTSDLLAIRNPQIAKYRLPESH